MFGQFIGQKRIRIVGLVIFEAFPSHDDHDYPHVFTFVTQSLFRYNQVFLVFVTSSNDLLIEL